MRSPVSNFLAVVKKIIADVMIYSTEQVKGQLAFCGFQKGLPVHESLWIFTLWIFFKKKKKFFHSVLWD